MKIRRIAATAVAAAVTAPVVFLSAAPAFADTKPAAGASQLADKPSIEQLKLAVAAAETAFDKAKADLTAAEKAVDALAKADHPLAVDVQTAKKVYDEAATAKEAAAEAVTKAEAALAALPEDATDEQKAPLEQAVKEAKAAAEAAAADATAKNEGLLKVLRAQNDAKAAALSTLDEARKAKKTARKALDDAEDALAEAEANLPDGEDMCVEDDKSLGTSLTGPSEITAGSSGVFTFRITNKGSKTFDEFGGFSVATTNGGMEWLDVKWSTSESPTWKPINWANEEELGFSANAPLAPGKSFDFKLKVSVDAKVPVGDGQVLAAGLRATYEDMTCGESETNIAHFTVVKPAKPGSGNNNGTNGGHNGNGTNGGTKGNGNASPQGGTSKTPVTITTHTPTTTTGRLAATGAGPSTLPFALAGGAAVVLGAGAMVMVRRRKAGEGA
ncbi:LPXTG-motif cell wall anchor domain protein [Streptomyces laurentii]|uniref:LPXTG-motif cell wall anchor domain protein n=1 Tax=Streptomyces laurentii TaxID=39478 RepID=A0A160P1H8_STRLU|nr:LPXTG-motif cell wall anchor domain protein [Streptomyces laurentii]